MAENRKFELFQIYIDFSWHIIFLLKKLTFSPLPPPNPLSPRSPLLPIEY